MTGFARFRFSAGIAVLLLAVWVSAQAAEYVVQRLKEPALSQETGLDAAILDDLAAAIEAGKYGNVRTLLVSRRGQLALEVYQASFRPDRRQNLYSVTKSVLATLVGIAIAEGYLAGVEAPILGFFPDYPADTLDPRWQEVTLRHLLTMSVGIQWDDRLDLVSMLLTADPVGSVFDKPFVAAPGEEYRYNSGLSHVIAEILHRTTGSTPEALAEDWLFAPLGITEWFWEKGSDGVSYGGWGLRMTPLDLLTIGELYARGGTIGGAQIVPPDWIERSTSAHAPREDCYDYGYHWWRYADCYSDALGGLYFACGLGQQYLWIDEARELVVAMTAQNDRGQTSAEPLLWQHILPAVIE
jgi:CubicO group peptidase (beta-lactamase class C family)